MPQTSIAIHHFFCLPFSVNFMSSGPAYIWVARPLLWRSKNPLQKLNWNWVAGGHAYGNMALVELVGLVGPLAGLRAQTNKLLIRFSGSRISICWEMRGSYWNSLGEGFPWHNMSRLSLRDDLTPRFSQVKQKSLLGGDKIICWEPVLNFDVGICRFFIGSIFETSRFPVVNFVYVQEVMWNWFHWAVYLGSMIRGLVQIHSVQGQAGMRMKQVSVIRF